MSKRIILAAAALIGAALSLNAQSFTEGFFLRGFNRAYQYNPAIVGENDFIGLPQWNFNLVNNVGAGAFLYPVDDVLVTGLHSSIPASTFLGNIPENPRFRGDINATIMSYGFLKGGAYHTIDVNVRATYGASLPKELFKFLKLGAEDGSADLSGIGLGGNLFIELAYGYGRKVNDWLSLGGRVKLLLPMHGVQFDISRLDLTTNQEELGVSLRGDLYLTNHMADIHTNSQGYWDLSTISGKEALGFKPSGAGAALDLGLLANPADGLTLSLSIQDLGLVFSYYGNRATMGGTATFKGFDEVTYQNLNGNDMKKMLTDTGKKFLGLLKPIGFYGHSWRTEKLHMQANLGVKYEMPFYRRLAVGATGRFIAGAGLPYWEGRGALEINPLNWLDITANLGYGTQGAVFGLAAAVKFHHFQLTAGWEDGFGRTLVDARTPIQRNFRTFTVGLTYSL